MKFCIPFNRLFVLTTCLLIGTARASAEETATNAKFSDPSKSGTLKIILARGDIRIQGIDTQEVVVTSEAKPQRQPRKDGLRVLTESASYSLTEKNNVMTLDAGSEGWMGGAAEFKVTVPRNTSVVVANSLGGDIVCKGITGDIDIQSLHGEVRLDDLAGGAVVNTMNGEIKATIRELHEGKALSFTSMNGEVELWVPTSAKANVRLRTQNGSILTDFDEKTLVTKVENVSGGRHGHMLTTEMREAFRQAARASAVAGQQVAEALREAAEAAREGVGQDEVESDKNGTPGVHPTPPVPPVPPVMPSIPPMSGGKLVTGTLNGGGTDIAVTTMNGDVKLRQIETK